MGGELSTSSEGPWAASDRLVPDSRFLTDTADTPGADGAGAIFGAYAYLRCALTPHIAMRRLGWVFFKVDILRHSF